MEKKLMSCLFFCPDTWPLYLMALLSMMLVGVVGAKNYVRSPYSKCCHKKGTVFFSILLSTWPSYLTDLLSLRLVGVIGVGIMRGTWPSLA